MTKSITFDVREITYDNGLTEIAVVTPKQWAGRMRTKGWKKTIITKKQLASITIKIKTK